MYGMPAKDLMKQTEIDPKLRDHVKNMVYVGALAHLLVGHVPTGSTVHALLDGRGRPLRVPVRIKDLIG